MALSCCESAVGLFREVRLGGGDGLAAIGEGNQFRRALRLENVGTDDLLKRFLAYGFLQIGDA